MRELCEWQEITILEGAIKEDHVHMYLSVPPKHSPSHVMKEEVISDSFFVVMGKQKRQLTAAEKAEKRRRRKECMAIFINGKQKRVKRPPTIDGMDVDEFIHRNADHLVASTRDVVVYR